MKMLSRDELLVRLYVSNYLVIYSVHYPKENSINALSTALYSLLDNVHCSYYLSKYYCQIVGIRKTLKTYSDPLVNSDGLEPNFFQ